MLSPNYRFTATMIGVEIEAQIVISRAQTRWTGTSIRASMIEAEA